MTPTPRRRFWLHAVIEDNKIRLSPPWLAAIAWLAVFVLWMSGASAVAAAALRPTEVAASPDGKTLYVVLEGANAIAEVDTASKTLRRTIPCPATPHDVAVLDAGKTLAVAAGGNPGSLLLIDAGSGRVGQSIPLGHTPRSPVAAGGNRLFVLEQFDGKIVEIDRASGTVTRRTLALREPVDAAITPDGQTLVVANLLPEGPANVEDVAAAITCIDVNSGNASTIRLPTGTTALRSVAITPDGRHAVAVHLLGRFQLPTSQIERGWMISNALTVIDLATRKVQATVLLDEIDRGSANPWGVAVTDDGSRIVVSHSGTHELSVIDLPGLLAKLSQPRDLPPSSDLAFLVGLRRTLPINAETPPSGNPALQGPRGLALVGDVAYTAVMFNDMIARTQLNEGTIETIPLGPAPERTVVHRGEMHFYDATLCFQGWQSCSSCHPDTRADALNWDLLNDSLGNPKNTKSLLLAHETPPAMFLGVRADAPTGVRAGFRHVHYAAPNEEIASAVDAYLRALKPVPGPSVLDGKPNAAADRGRELFTSERLRCAHCHPSPLFTDLKMHDVHTQGTRDHEPAFDTPTLVECWRTAPYLHDGRYPTLDALLREGKHGNASSLSDAEFQDLLAYLRSL